MVGEDATWDWVWKLALGCLLGWVALKMLWRWLSTTVWHWLTSDFRGLITSHPVWSALIGLPIAAIAVAALRSRSGTSRYVYFDDDDDLEEEPEVITFRTHQLAAMTPTGFEQACADLLVRDGFHPVRRSGGAGDLGADVIAWDSYGRKIVVQCKRYKKPVGNEEVQRFSGTARPEHGADVPIMVGLNGFTPACGPSGRTSLCPGPAPVPNWSRSPGRPVWSGVLRWVG